jgi:chromosome partitioning protein
VRPEHCAKITAVPLKDGKLEIEADTEVLVLDSPAGLHDQKLINITRAAQTAIIPVLPSPIDIRAAGHFLQELISLRNKINRKIRIATVANRVREDTVVAAKLEMYLEKLELPGGQHIPFITMLRQSQNYIQAAETGMTIFELPPSRTSYDREQWEPL